VLHGGDSRLALASLLVHIYIYSIQVPGIFSSAINT